MGSRVTVAAAALIAGGTASASAQDADELSKQLSNPVASLISVPFQNNFEFGAGPDDDGFSYTLNIQPVIPIHINDDWNIISRTILPIGFRDYIPDEGDIFGLGDTTQSFFLSPRQPGPGGLIWGVGPAFLVPTATDDVLGTGKFGIGPTAVALVQKDQWTIGALGNHIWSVAGEGSRPDVNQTFLQPFVSYALGKGRSITLNTESTYDWEGSQWTVPINLMFAQVTKFGEQPVSLQIGGKYYADAPEGAPEWGIRANITFLFPTK
ncbi:transporter [Rhizobiaceae bacterium n13]|uniref:Transporter n=1 Tax=Ferirhizobium litorale TaxID=2927786 RepID=A0AAE3QGX2_9HYPH|nr:transporter [Fererhizobium litorale]MDI7924811.1 transporter [Fererhizobium litorale]